MKDANIDPSATAALLDLLNAHRVTAVLHAATQLGVAEALADGALPATELARRTGAHEPSLLRLLRALVALGVCDQLAGGGFALTPMGALLAADAPASLRPWALFEGAFLRRSWTGLVDSIRSGKTAAQMAGFDNSFDMMEQHQEIVAMFNAAMVAMTRTTTSDIVAAYDFGGIGTLMDVGGGHGELLSAVLGAYPSMRGVVFDLPRCAEGARKHFAGVGLGERAEFVAGSFFDSVPSGADAIVMKSIIHDWSDERSVAILKNCRRALPGGGKLLLVERLMPERPQQTAEDLMVVLSDLNMLRGPGGAERTEGEYRAILGASGFDLTRVVRAGRLAVLESRPA